MNQNRHWYRMQWKNVSRWKGYKKRFHGRENANKLLESSGQRRQTSSILQISLAFFFLKKRFCFLFFCKGCLK